MKVFLVQPPIQDFYDTPIRLQPLGLAYLKSAVQKHLPDVEVVIRDFHLGRGRRTTALPPELSYLREYYPFPDQSPFSLFHHYFHFGASFEILAQEVSREKPDLVGISSLFTPYFREVLRCAEAIKKVISCPIVVGGAHVSALPELMLKNPSIDFVIQGEGERPLVELIKALQDGRGYEMVPNLGYKKGHQTVLNPLKKPYPINALPFPDFSDFALETYRYGKRPLSFLITSRGCPHHCSFCSVHQTFRDYRTRTAEDVFREISLRFQEGFRVFDFEDDNLTFKRETTRALCSKMTRAFSPGMLECLAMNGISHQSLDPELLKGMKEAGFTHLNLSLVSSNPGIMRETKRAQGMKPFLQVVQTAFRLKFKIVVYQILGLPEESLDSMIRTLLLTARLPVLLGASPFYLTPGTPIAQKFPAQTETDLIRSRLTALGSETGQCKREDIYTLFIITRILNFFKGLRFSPDRIKFDEVLGIARSLGKRSEIGVKIFDRLLSEKILYAFTRGCFLPLPRFNADLFFKFWERLDSIRTQEGKIILKQGIPDRLTA